MAMPWSSAALITSSSRIEPPGWITAVAPASIATRRPSANGKERVGCDHGAQGERFVEPAVLRRVLGLARGDARGIDAAHLPGADADGGEILGVDDGVRFHVLGDAEGKGKIGKLGVGRRARGHGLERHVVDDGIVARLHQQAAGDRFHGHAGRARIGQAAGDQQPQILLGADDGDRFLARVRAR